MRYAGLTALCFALALLAPALAGAQPAAGSADLAANAALQYWQAFNAMPTLDKQQEEILNNWQTAPLDDAAQKLIEASRTSLMYLHRGAKLERCDWGLDYNDGLSLLLPHLAKARQLALLAALRGRSEFEAGNSKGARTDATAIMRLARHTGRDPIMISILVRHLIEGIVVDLVAPHLPDVKAPPESVLAEFKSLPPAATLEQSLAMEKKYMAGHIINELKKAEANKPGSWKPLWLAMLGNEATEELKNAESLEQTLKWVNDTLPAYDELARMVALSPAEFDKQYPAFKEETTRSSPVAAVLLPAIDKLRGTENRSRVRMDMLLAATAVVHSGPEALESTKDLFGDGPYEYRKLESGFELSSRLTHEGKPVTLRIGRSK